MRKHHNKLFFGQYTHKAKFKIPEANKLYPTNDLKCLDIVNNSITVTPLSSLATFLMEHRHDMKFRIQYPNTIIYSNEKIIHKAIGIFWNFWNGVTTTDPKTVSQLGNKTVVCKRLPLGKYQYQVHVHRKMQSRISSEQKAMLHQYLTQNKENATVTNQTLKNWLTGEQSLNYGYNGYFYVKDKKALLPIYMISQHIVDKVTKFVKI